MNRRKFLSYVGCGCCGFIIPSCTTAPITERKQLSIISESRINRQAASAYETFRKKTKLITSGSKLKEIKEIGKKMEVSVSAFFKKEGKNDPTKNFGWDYVLVDNDKKRFCVWENDLQNQGGSGPSFFIFQCQNGSNYGFLLHFCPNLRLFLHFDFFLIFF